MLTWIFFPVKKTYVIYITASKKTCLSGYLFLCLYYVTNIYKNIMNYVMYSVHQDSDMPRSNLVHIVLPVKFCSWWTFERETWKENYPFQTEKCHEIINNGSQKSTKLGFCGHVVFSFRKRKSLKVWIVYR